MSTHLPSLRRLSSSPQLKILSNHASCPFQLYANRMSQSSKALLSLPYQSPSTVRTSTRISPFHHLSWSSSRPSAAFSPFSSLLNIYFSSNKKLLHIQGENQVCILSNTNPIQSQSHPIPIPSNSIQSNPSPNPDPNPDPNSNPNPPLFCSDLNSAGYLASIVGTYRVDSTPKNMELRSWLFCLFLSLPLSFHRPRGRQYEYIYIIITRSPNLSRRQVSVGSEIFFSEVSHFTK